MAESPLMISVSGLRGVVGEGLTPPRVAQFAAVGAGVLVQAAARANRPTKGAIVLSRDSRPHGEMLAQAASAGLRAAGHSVVDAGIAATPTVGVLVRHLGALGAIQITASHNPPQWNGAKLFNFEGRVLGGADAEVLAERFRRMLGQGEAHGDPGMLWANWQHVGERSVDPDPHQPHLEAILRYVDARTIATRGPHVVLDANHGAGGILGTRLLEQLGCRVTVLGGDPDGRFAHAPEPLEENLSELCGTVVRHRADMGFALDPDADRLAVVDEAGCYVGEEYTLALVVDHVLTARPGPVVTNVSTTKAVEDLARRHGCPCHRTKVGEANVVDKMLREGAAVGGEGNGGVIDPRVGMVRDSFAGMALILESLAQRRQSVGAWVGELPHYRMVKQKLALEGRSFAEAEQALIGAFANAEFDRTDGLRLIWADQWLHIRPSNTEPVLRVIAEASSTEQADHLCREARQLLERGRKNP